MPLAGRDHRSGRLTNVNELDQCALDLGTVSITIDAHPSEIHTFTLEVQDGYEVSSDHIELTILNSSPDAAFLQCSGTYSLGENVVVQGTVSDFDGDTLNYAFKEGANILCSGTLTPPAGGNPVDLPDCVVSGFWLGTHHVTLEVDETYNDPFVTDPPCELTIVDTTAPTLAPSVDKGILWPPNHKMVVVTIETNASDDSGLPVNLSAVVTSNEPVEGLGDGDTAPDWIEPQIDPATGVITMQLRAERSGTGEGREYTISITATDDAGNTSTADVVVIVPHDKKKK